MIDESSSAEHSQSSSVSFDSAPEVHENDTLSTTRRAEPNFLSSPHAAPSVPIILDEELQTIQSSTHNIETSLFGTKSDVQPQTPPADTTNAPSSLFSPFPLSVSVPYMSQALPPGYALSREARVGIHKIAQLFLMMLTSTASEAVVDPRLLMTQSELENLPEDHYLPSRHVLQRQDIEAALKATGFADWVPLIRSRLSGASSPKVSTKRTSSVVSANKTNPPGSVGSTTGNVKSVITKKRPLSAYFVFTGEARPLLMKEHPGWKVSQIAKELGARWRAMTEEEKFPYVKKAQELREQCREEGQTGSDEAKSQIQID